MQSLINTLQPVLRIGEIEQCIGLKLVAKGPPNAIIGEVCDILDHQDQVVSAAEVIGFIDQKVYLMPYNSATIRMGYRVRATGQQAHIQVNQSLLGHIVDAFARPIDGSKLQWPISTISTQNKKHNPLNRQVISERIHTNIQAIDAMLPLGKGQRMGIFAGSGVGKSMLLGQIAKNSTQDVNVIALIGERGREVNEFIKNHLDESTLKRSVLVIACSDEAALMRRQAAYSATAIAEYFALQGKDVMLFMDSITRFAMAQREIGISLGEPPTARGYTPSVFSLLPGLVERAGAFAHHGSITALYSVLVEGDDFNEPLADHMRSLLDGHIVLSRKLAQSGHYPAISILQSISRLATQLQSKEEQEICSKVLSILSLYEQNKDLIELGAYKSGTNLALDRAIERINPINQLLKQSQAVALPLPELINRFKDISK